MHSVSITGCGWLGLALAQHLNQQGWPVRGSSRNPDTLAVLKREGIPGFELQLGFELQCDEADRLFDADVLVANVPPGRVDGDASYAHRMALLARAAKAAGIDKAIFVSATSVYAAGENVDEDAPLDSGPRARAMLDAEQAFRQVFGDGLTILRPSGLVGGQRHPGRFLAGRKAVPGADAAINLVHRDDVVGAIQRIMELGAWNRCYNLAAPAHPSRQAFYTRAAERLGLAPPEFSTEAMANKRIDGQRIVVELGFRYRFEDPFEMPLDAD